MLPTSRKQFIKDIAFTTAALALPSISIFGKKINYSISQETENVTYFEKPAAEYETLRKGFNKRINKFPKVIALCQNTQGVSEAILYAKQKGLKVTVKSGGHCMEGFSCLEDGMVINLSVLNTIAINGATIKVGPATTLKKIYETIIPKGKYLPGGSCQTVAIGGLTLGGGYGLLSRAYGLTCDSLLEATMVDGNGNIVTTKNNSELLWALKGGGNSNFGVVTEMKFTLHDAPNTMTSYKFRNQNVTVTKAKEICATWFTESKLLPKGCFSAFIYNGKTTYILLTNINKNNTITTNFINTFEALSTKVTKGNPLPLGTALKAYYAEANPITFKNASAGLYKSFADIENVIDAVFNLVKQSPGILYQVNTLGGAITNADFEAASSFAHRDCFYFSELQAYWDSPTATTKKLQQFEAIQQQFTNAGVTAQYRNYPDINFKKWEQLYYGKSLNRLLAIKQKYDVNNIFGGIQTLKA
jgi:hypothetical protein